MPPTPPITTIQELLDYLEVGVYPSDEFILALVNKLKDLTEQ